jgi:ribonuclease HI
MSDCIAFDGSCEPNPGGRMGMGWVITWEDGRTTTGQAEQPATHKNTNNVAEYTACQFSLEAYRDAGGTGPVIVQGDSQLVIYQVNEQWSVKNPRLASLCFRIRKLGRLLHATFVWVPREKNQAADMLSAIMDANPVPPLRDGAPVRVPQKLHRAIRRLNKQQGRPGFKDLLNLRVGGRDSLSVLSLTDLHTHVTEEVAGYMAQKFPDKRHQAAALRWFRRGLRLDLAVRKVQIDQEIQRNIERKRETARL